MMRASSSLAFCLVAAVVWVARTTVAGSVPDLKLGVMDWVTYDSVEQIDDGQTNSMIYNWFLAVAHFNERRGDILPVLNEPWVKQCMMNISIVRFCDTHALLRKSASDTVRLVDQVDALVGYATAAEGRQATVISDVVRDVPVVSHWSTTPATEDREIYKLFTRTIVSDADMAVKIAEFIIQSGYTAVTGLAMVQDSAPELRQAVKDALLVRGCVAQFFDFDVNDPETMERAVENVAGTGLNVILVITYNYVTIESLAPLMVKHNLHLGDKLLVFTNMDFLLPSSEIAASPNVSSLLKGAFRVATKLDAMYHPLVDAYRQRWENGEFGASYTNFLNDHLPPNGDGNDTFFCENDLLNLTLSPNSFNEFAGRYTDMWGIVYDAVMTVGLGACISNGTRRGADLLHDMLNLGFDGLSGRVEFDPSTGNRKASTFVFQLQNFQPVVGGPLGVLQGVEVATFNTSLGKFEYSVDPETLVFRRGIGMAYASLQVDAPETNFNYLPTWLRVIGRIEFALIVIMAFGASAWLFLNRKETVVVNSQGPLMHLICLGCVIASMSILMLTFDDAPSDAPNIDMNQVCMAIPVLFTVGFQIALLALCGKTYRVYSIWNNNKIITRKLSIGRVMYTVGLLVLLEIVILACWIAFAPLKYKRLVLSRDRFDQPLNTLGMCDAPTWTSGAFATVVFILHGFSLVIMGFLAYQVSDMPTQFGESRWLGLSNLSLSQIYFICLPAIAAVYSVNVVGRFLLATFMVFLSAFAIMFFMFAPKMYLIATGKEIFRKTTTNSRLRLGESKQALNERHSKSTSQNDVAKLVVAAGSVSVKPMVD